MQHIGGDGTQAVSYINNSAKCSICWSWELVVTSLDDDLVDCLNAEVRLAYGKGISVI